MKSASLTITTKDGQNLIRGRPGRPGKPPIYGMLTFARIVSEIVADAHRDNPYAEHFLLKVEEAFARCEQSFEAAQKQLHPLQQQGRNLIVRLEQSAPHSPPIEVPLNFATPYGFMGAHLLSDYDSLVDLSDKCALCGLLTKRECSRIQKRITRSLRGVYHSVSAYRSIPVTRTQILENTPLAEDAKSQIAELPEAVLTGEIRPRFLVSTAHSKRPNESKILDGIGS